MARMKFRNGWNYDSATRQVDTGDFDFILDTSTDVGAAFALVVDAAIDAGLEDFSENFIAENDLLTQATADTLYELIGAVVAHAAEVDPHTQYTTSAEVDAAVVAHEAEVDPHTQYTTDAEVATAISAALGSAAFVRDTETITTASLADDAEGTGTVTLAAGYRLLGIEVDRACRVRLYTTSTARTNDAARAVGTDVDTATDHGLVFEYVAAAAIDVDLSPLVDGMCPTGTTVYWAIQNLSGGTSTVEVIFDWIRTE
jgi:hypothetical protein